jgi:undecaprenyl-diphosphatase
LGLSETEFLKSFEIAIQFGAMCAVIALYFKSFLNIQIITRILAAFVPTAIAGFLLYDFLKEELLGNLEVVLWSLLIGGIALIVFEFFHKEKPNARVDVKSISYAQAFWIGLCQALAIIPGVSRSGATILGGLAAGVSRVAIVEFSFLLAVPTIGAATAYDLYKNGSSFLQSDVILLGIGFVVSFLVALWSIRFLLNFVRNRTFVPFGVYRIILSLFFFLIIL